MDKMNNAQETMADIQAEQNMAQMPPVNPEALAQQSGQEQVELATPQITTEEGE